MPFTRGFVIAVSLIVCVVVTASGAGAEDRPSERVSPPPQCNPDAVVWRTPEPPADPRKGDIWVNPLDGMEMVYVAAGEFVMGTSADEIRAWLMKHTMDEYAWFAPEAPRHRVHLDGYWIGRTEVTNAQYLRFVRATGHPAPEHWWRGRIPAALEDFPVVFLDWEGAQAYCEWTGGRLPTEPEWEKAARGGDGRMFPWAGQWDKRRCRNFELIGGRMYSSRRRNETAFMEWTGAHDELREGATLVGSYAAGASPYGCLDMAGNVWEWCADWYHARAYERHAQGQLTPPRAGPSGTRVIRGGGFTEAHPRTFRCAYRDHREPWSRELALGFRCARAAQRAQSAEGDEGEGAASHSGAHDAPR